MTLDKVTAFVTRKRAAGLELLVFAHPSAGVQLPAGSVEPGEEPAVAAVREVVEETGVSDCVVVEHLATTVTELPPGLAILTRTVSLGAGTLSRGNLVEVHSPGEWSLAVYEEYDHNVEPRVLLRRLEGRVPAAALGQRVDRHMFHLRSDDPRERWERAADGHVFRPYWAPLEPGPRLVQGQDLWLRSVYDRLLASARRAHAPP
jgi:8-oxo-dGTP pyrophosphatase MutT (NUDIX family)